MGKLLVHEFITLDGVFETPSWTAEYPFDPMMGQAIAGIMGSCEGLLLGRNTFEMFAASWSGRSAEDDPGAPFMNDSPKHVVSSTLESAEWRNSSIMGAYDPEAIRSLKQKLGGDLYVSGSGTLVRALLKDGLVDQLHLFVYPLVLGDGARLFGDAGPGVKFRLAGHEAYDSGVVHLTYEQAR
jgi:dihydrofolate reductase